MKAIVSLLVVVCLPGLLGAKASSYSLLGDLQSAMTNNAKRSAGEHATVDLHNEQFCVDISFYQDTKWVEEYSEECKTEFHKKCEEKSENVCADTVETHCEVVPYTECSMSTEDVDYSETELLPMAFTPKTCKTVNDVVKHQKMFPECRNVTKQNCETLWETDAQGKQVWAGKENCQPVTWQECKLVPRYVDFIIPKVECEDLEQLWYHEPQPVDKVKTTNVLTCVVKSTTDCKEKTGHSCKTIKYQECKEVPMTDCQPSHVHKPAQEQVHKKKCLLPDEPPAPSYGAPEAPSYSAPAPAPVQARSYPTLPPAVPSYGGRQGRSRGGRLL